MASSRQTRLRSDKYNANITKRGVVTPAAVVDVSRADLEYAWVAFDLIPSIIWIAENGDGPESLSSSSWLHFLRPRWKVSQLEYVMSVSQLTLFLWTFLQHRVPDNPQRIEWTYLLRPDTATLAEQMCNCVDKPSELVSDSLGTEIVRSLLVCSRLNL
jgi:hypothetical protein